jgi:D-3-phosphoglycerate dehydrogenase / 2-oxoglutarate reductase
MITSFTAIMGAAGINIAEMTNKSRGEVAYTILDLDSAISDEVAGKLAAADGVFRVRKIK